MVPFSFAGEDFLIMGQGALFWPARKALLIADLHLEKASFFARFGQMLPPYDSNATLAAIEALADETGARELWCLGDSFHDGEGPFRLDEQARTRLLALAARLDWTWITGNHDPLTIAPGGRVLDEACLHGICLRHETLGSDRRPEISGHWHPKLRMRVRGQNLSRRCFVHAPGRLILPAFGAFTGGMRADDPAITKAVGTPAEALVPANGRLLRFPLAG